MIKITIENTETGEKMMAECDAYALATIENMGAINEKIYTSIDNVGNRDIDIAELAEAIVDRVIDENMTDCAEAIGIDIQDIVDICNSVDGDCDECCCSCQCCEQ